MPRANKKLENGLMVKELNGQMMTKKIDSNLLKSGFNFYLDFLLNFLLINKYFFLLIFIIYFISNLKYNY